MSARGWGVEDSDILDRTQFRYAGQRQNGRVEKL